MTDRLPRNLRRRDAAERAARPRCSYCPKAVLPSSLCGCCCSEHDTDVGATARALLSIGTTQPAPRTDSPSLREFLASKGEI